MLIMPLVARNVLPMVVLEYGAPVSRVLDVVSKHELLALILEHSGHSCFTSMSQNRPSVIEMKSGPDDVVL